MQRLKFARIIAEHVVSSTIIVLSHAPSCRDSML